MDKIKIIAEIAQGYEGDINLCKKFIKLAKKSGADGVKFQIFEADELCIENYVHYDLFKSLYISPNKWVGIIKECSSLGLEFYADVFGVKSLRWMLKNNVSGIKIHSSDLKNYELLNELKNRKIRIILGAGGSTLKEINKAIELLGNNEIIIMSGFQAEPNLIEDIELNKLQIIKKATSCKVGYADHIEVKNPLAKSLPSMAVLMGANYIEKHLTIDRDNLQLEDYISALNPNEFLEMVNMIRDIENMPNPWSSEFNLTIREKKYRQTSKKIILSNSKLPKGHLLKNEDLVMLRTDEKFDEILDFEDLVGKELNCIVMKHKIIRKDFLK